MLKQLKVLYVEDDEDTVRAMSRFLKRRVGTLVTAMDGKEGLRQYYSERPDVIIVDLLLPEEGGIEMIRKIRETDKHCKIIVTSTVNNLDTIIDAVSLKIEYYIMKPVKTDSFEMKLNALAEDIAAAPFSARGRIFFESDTARNEADQNIKSGLAKLIKEKMGRGPKNIRVCFYDDSVELIITGAFTAMDLSLLSEKKNSSIVEHNRRLFYEITSVNIETIISEILSAPFKITEVDIDVTELIDRIVLEEGL